MRSLDGMYFANLNFVCRIADFLSADADSAWKNPNATFEQNKLYFVTEGRCFVTIQERTYTLQAGDLLFIPADVFHSYCSHPEKPLKKFWMHFDLYPDAVLEEMAKLPNLVHVGREAFQEISELFIHLVRCNQSGYLTDRLEAKAAGMRLLAHYLRLAMPEGISVSDGREEALTDLLAYIQRNLSMTLSNRELAEVIHLHPTYFCRWFRDKVGTAPQQYILQLRLEEAKRLLEKSDCSISQIANQVGMQNPGHLSHAFRRYYALSPTEYRAFANRQELTALGPDASE